MNYPFSCQAYIDLPHHVIHYNSHLDKTLNLHYIILIHDKALSIKDDYIAHRITVPMSHGR